MSLTLSNYEIKTENAVRSFWTSRSVAQQQQQKKSGKSDQGERSGVTAGKNMDGFIELFIDIIHENGLNNVEIHQKRSALTLPGFFRPTKIWDLLVTHKGKLIAALELKSQVGPSFGNNFNNRTEEAIGMALDFWTAYREGAFGNQSRPFVGWLMLVEDAEKSRSPVRDTSPHFPIFEEFKGVSYLQRYDLLCQKLMKEQLYTNAALLTSPRSAADTGSFSELSIMTGMRTFVSSLAGHVAAEAVRIEE
ncbi:MAG: PaeR7I family type II restriction endonuclease [Candidatus Electrothrix sp.]